VLAADTGLPKVLSVDLGGSSASADVRRWSIDTLNVDYATPTGHIGFGDMTRDVHGRYLAYVSNFGGSFDETPALFEIDPATGAVELLVESASAAPRVASLTWLPDGDLLGYEFPSGLIRIDPDTLAPTAVPLDKDLFVSGGLATSSNGTVYALGSVFDGQPGVSTKLFTVDVDSGAVVEIGGLSGLSVSISYLDIAFTPSGRLIGMTDINATHNGGVLQADSIYEIDLQTGLPIFITQVGSIVSGIVGFEFVPEPATAAYVWAAIVAIGHMRRRRA
jgi:hypothetical protein